MNAYDEAAAMPPPFNKSLPGTQRKSVYFGTGLFTCRCPQDNCVSLTMIQND